MDKDVSLTVRGRQKPPGVTSAKDKVQKRAPPRTPRCRRTAASNCADSPPSTHTLQVSESGVKSDLQLGNASNFSYAGEHKLSPAGNSGEPDRKLDLAALSGLQREGTEGGEGGWSGAGCPARSGPALRAEPEPPAGAVRPRPLPVAGEAPAAHAPQRPAAEGAGRACARAGQGAGRGHSRL